MGDVEDGRSAPTAATLRAREAEFPALRMIRHDRSYGQSAAIRSGVKAARAEWIATLDGDGQNDPADIPRLWAMARAEASAPMLITGQRTKRRDSWMKRVASRVANRVRAALLGDVTPHLRCRLHLFPPALSL